MRRQFRRIPVSLVALAVAVGLLTQGVAITWGRPAQARISYAFGSSG